MSGAVFVDTSALYAVLDGDDARHAQAATHWSELLDGTVDGRRAVITHSAVVVETTALVQRRLGMPAVRALHDDVLPVLTVHWIEAELHARAVSALLAAARRDVSLVDWMSFELMRERGIEEAFAYDDDFEAQGFTLIE